MIAIILINYKMEDLTISFVKKELSKVSEPHITVIVNNGATDESNSKLRNALDAQIITDIKCEPERNIFVISSYDNLGFAKGNNLGADFCERHFHPEYILFTNNDIRLKDRDVVEQLIQKLTILPDAGVIGPKVIGLDGMAQSPWPYTSFWNRHIWVYWSTLFCSREKKIKIFRLDYPQKAKEGFHYYVMGSFFLVRSKDFFQCGMFDPNTFLYAEELILSERMRVIGKGMYYYPEVTVIHEHGATTSNLKSRKSGALQYRSECYYYRSYRHTNLLVLLLGHLTFFLRRLI